MVDANLPRPNAEYGHRSKQTIAVTAGSGFRKPGVHHVPRGTTLRQFLKSAQILPKGGWQHFDMSSVNSGCRLKQFHNGQRTGFLSRGKPSEKQFDTILEDGADVAVLMYNW